MGQSLSLGFDVVDLEYVFVRAFFDAAASSSSSRWCFFGSRSIRSMMLEFNVIHTLSFSSVRVRGWFRRWKSSGCLEADATVERLSYWIDRIQMCKLL
jgi:hypothetical protein